MSTVIATTILPDNTANDKVTIGGTGDTVVVAGNILNVDTLQDTGGNTIFASDGAGKITSSDMPGAMKWLATQTGEGVSSISFTNPPMDTTYDVYRFMFVNINPATDATQFTFQCSINGGSNYNIIGTSTYYQSYAKEEGAVTGLQYVAAQDQSEKLIYQPLGNTWGNAADEAGSGELLIFAPGSTTYMKHYMANVQGYDGSSGGENYAQNNRVAGYFNTTAAVNAIDFKMSAGAFDGTISMYGISKS